MDLRYPEMRAEVIAALTSLSDRDYQQRVWVERRMPGPNYDDSLDTVVHTLFDDIDVCVDPERWVGLVLQPGEVEALQAVGSVFRSVLDDLGDVADADYLADARWPEVVSRAASARAALTGSGH